VQKPIDLSERVVNFGCAFLHTKLLPDVDNGYSRVSHVFPQSLAVLLTIGYGAAGATGATGANGSIADFAEFYALMPPDNAATVAVGADECRRISL
jgi:hypothetical protein